MTSGEKYAWLACAIDSEGYIGFHKRRRTVRGRSYMCVSSCVTVANNDLRFIEVVRDIVRDITGAALRIASKRLYTGNTSYSISVTSNHTLAALMEALIPYFVIKRDKAERLLAWARYRGSGQVGRRFTPSDIAFATSIGLMIEQPKALQGEPDGA